MSFVAHFQMFLFLEFHRGLAPRFLECLLALHLLLLRLSQCTSASVYLAPRTQVSEGRGFSPRGMANIMTVGDQPSPHLDHPRAF